MLRYPEIYRNYVAVAGDRVVAAAREQGMDEIEVGTEIDNAAARGFYRSAGFDREYLLLGREL